MPLDQVGHLAVALRDHLLACAPAAATGALSDSDRPQSGRPITSTSQGRLQKQGPKGRSKRKKGKSKGGAGAEVADLDAQDADSVSEQVMLRLGMPSSDVHAAVLTKA